MKNLITIQPRYHYLPTAIGGHDVIILPEEYMQGPDIDPKNLELFPACEKEFKYRKKVKRLKSKKPRNKRRNHVNTKGMVSEEAMEEATEVL